jgi:hypothetical protein
MGVPGVIIWGVWRRSAWVCVVQIRSPLRKRRSGAKAYAGEVQISAGRKLGSTLPLVGRVASEASRVGVVRWSTDGPPPPTPPHKGGGEHTEYAAITCLTYPGSPRVSVVGWAKARCSAYPRGQNRVRHSPSKTGVTPSLPTRRRYRKRFCPPYSCSSPRKGQSVFVFRACSCVESARAANSVCSLPPCGGGVGRGVVVVARSVSTDSDPQPVQFRSSPRKRGPRATVCGPWTPACAGANGARRASARAARQLVAAMLTSRASLTIAATSSR